MILKNNELKKYPTVVIKFKKILSQNLLK